METSPSIQKIAEALQLFHLKVGKIKKDASNPFFKSKYATLSNILDQIEVPLQESDLVITQFPDDDHCLTSLLVHTKSGEWMKSRYKMSPVPEYIKEKDKGGNVLFRSTEVYDNPQAIGSALTYARRYAIGAILSLNIDEDDDGNAASGKGSYQQPPRQSTTELPWLNGGTDEFKGAVEKMKAGKSSVEALRKYFRISKEVEQKLQEAVKSK